jgi:hypothetical protein
VIASWFLCLVVINLGKGYGSVKKRQMCQISDFVPLNFGLADMWVRC